MIDTRHFNNSLFPVEVVNLIPPTEASADCQVYCEGIDGQEYAVKQVSDYIVFPHTPFDELFCYELASLCSIPVPSYNILQMPDSSLAFGSVWEGGVIKDGFFSTLQKAQQGDYPILSKEKMTRLLSSIYAFDLFIYNEDRHFGNYLIRPYIKSISILTMDYSRSWTNLLCPLDHQNTWRQFPDLPTAYTSPPHDQINAGKISNTLKCAKILWDLLGGISGRDFFSILYRLERIQSSNIEHILHKVPNEWCDSTRKSELLKWWDSSKRIDRVNEIKKAYFHGTLV